MLDTYFPLYIAVFVISLLLTCLIERRLIPLLSISAKQPIYEEGPKWHLSKSGTPTMGGVGFLIASTVALLISCGVVLIMDDAKEALSLIICLLYAAANSFIGIIDDYTKLKKKRNKGLSASVKLLLQFVAAILFLAARAILLGEETTLGFSFGEYDIGFIYYPISVIILLGITNCANLTDGIDGLASSVSFSIGVSLLYISAALSTQASSIASAIIGTSVGFLIFNLHPAKIFMGDTGSLYFGSLVACSGFVLGNPLITVFIAGVYVIEGCSVIIQVVWYKLTHRRVFKMAPLHHHLEKIGFSENRICIVAMILTFIFSIPVYIFFLP